MIAGLNVITDNLDYLLWGRAAAGEPAGYCSRY
jgi:polar amino acid transport system permease protein